MTPISAQRSSGWPAIAGVQRKRRSIHNLQICGAQAYRSAAVASAGIFVPNKGFVAARGHMRPACWGMARTSASGPSSQTTENAKRSTPGLREHSSSHSSRGSIGTTCAAHGSQGRLRFCRYHLVQLVVSRSTPQTFQVGNPCVLSRHSLDDYVRGNVRPIDKPRTRCEPLL